MATYVIEAVLPPDDTGLRERLYFGPVRGLPAARRAEDEVFNDEALDASAVSIVRLQSMASHRTVRDRSEERNA